MNDVMKQRYKEGLSQEIPDLIMSDTSNVFIEKTNLTSNTPFDATMTECHRLNPRESQIMETIKLEPMFKRGEIWNNIKDNFQTTDPP